MFIASSAGTGQYTSNLGRDTWLIAHPLAGMTILVIEAVDCT